MEVTHEFKTVVHQQTVRILVDEMLIEGNCSEFQRVVMELLEQGVKTAIVDFSGCMYIDSRGLGRLVTLTRKARQRGAMLLLQHMNEDLETLLELTNLSTLFDIIPPEDFKRQCVVLVPAFDAINNELIEHFARYPEKLDELDWRAFELLLDAVFQNHGFRTEVGPGRADGGIDLRLIQNDACGEILTLVQAKRYRSGRPIRLEAVQAFTAVVEDEKANRGLFVTTSRYLPSAKQFAERQRHRLTLADSTDVAKWCQIALRSRK